MFRSRSNYFNCGLVIKCLTAGRLRQHDIQQNLKVYMLALIQKISRTCMLYYRLRVMDYSPAQTGFKVFCCFLMPDFLSCEGFNSPSLNTSFHVQFQGEALRGRQFITPEYSVMHWGSLHMARRMTPSQEHQSRERIKRQDKRGYLRFSPFEQGS